MQVMMACINTPTVELCVGKPDEDACPGPQKATRRPLGPCRTVGRFPNAGAFSFGTSQRSQILNVRF